MTEKNALAPLGLLQNEFCVSKEIEGAAAATAANYGKIFVCPKGRKCEVLAVSEVHTTKGSDAGAVTLGLERLQGTETSGNGDDLITALNLKGTAETVQHGVVIHTANINVLSEGDRLNLVDTGTLTAVAGVCVTVLLRWRDI